MKTLREKFKNTEEAINLLHCVFEFFQRCFCVLKAFCGRFCEKWAKSGYHGDFLKYFAFLKVLIFN